MKNPSLLTTNEFFGIQIVHLPTSPGFPSKPENLVEFEGWVTQFADQYAASWNENMVYGRQDPLSTFKNTRRNISLGFDVVSPSATAASDNLIKINKLIQFQYPVYSQSGDVDAPVQGRNQRATLSAAPLIGLRWTNLISNASDGGYLIGYFKGVNYAPRIEEGGFINAPRMRLDDQEWSIATRSTDPTELFDASTTVGTDSRLEYTHGRSFIPKTVSLTLEFTVLHTHLMGWRIDDAGNYIFGNDKVNGKFPNASTIVEQTDATDIDIDGIPAAARTAIGSTILGGGGE